MKHMKLNSNARKGLANAANAAALASDVTGTVISGTLIVAGTVISVAGVATLAGGVAVAKGFGNACLKLREKARALRSEVHVVDEDGKVLPAFIVN